MQIIRADDANLLLNEKKGIFKIVLKAKANQLTMHIPPPTQKRKHFPVIHDYYVDKTASLKY